MMRSVAIRDLLSGYAAGKFTPIEIIDDVLTRIEAAPEHHAWIARLTRAELISYAKALEGQSVATKPLFGIPFAVKDNIDLQGVPTTAACQEFTYTPDRSATVVQKLIEAGAIPIGKTNLDQFATGLVGARSPYGSGRNGFDPEYISGGSSAGSAIAVAQGLASFALGTDTAGSGRVPAAFNNLIGLKPSCGLLSTAGVVPACRTLDCVSIFALDANDARRVLRVVEGTDARDPFSRTVARRAWPAKFRFGVPRTNQLQFFGDDEYERLFGASVECLTKAGGQRIEMDFEPFLETARLLYEGPWVAERYAAIADFIAAHPTSLHPVTRQVIEPARQRTAVETFQSLYRLQALRRATEELWSGFDVLVTPTAGTIYRIEQVEADPIRLNSNLGYYTNFVNLLDLAALAVPAGFRSDGMPFGITLIGRSGTDEALLRLAARVHDVEKLGLGRRLPPTSSPHEEIDVAPGFTAIAVCGAHMEGLPLNPQLTSRGGYFVRRTRSAPSYRLFALPGGPPARPGMVKVNEGGKAIDVEVWALPHAEVGSFLAGIPAPLGLGKVHLEDGSAVIGFTCDASGVTAAEDITHLGGWRAYLARA